ncbi:restriction endonuclease [Streptomyces sp. NPDC001941]|uniref:restriction endonuclease n=1 Tax=Streptomyces sp. NPDC001941 TaxID=3154659 RepID=UPI0033343012
MWGDVGLAVGQEVERPALHAALGGRRQGAIAASSQAGLIMLFVGSPSGWGADGAFHFVGEGVGGDQVMALGNRSVLRHREDGRELRLFEAAGQGRCRYLGRVEVDEERPWYRAHVPDPQGRPRGIIVFRLRPVGPVAPGGPSADPRLQAAGAPHPAGTRPVREPSVPEQSVRDSSVRESGAGTEARLTRAYASHLASLGREVTRARVRVPGERGPLYVDLMDVTENRLVEVSRTTTRQAIRTGIGTLLDHRRHFSPTPALVVLVPQRPGDDLVDLCSSLLIEVVWPVDGEGFASSHD